MANLNRVFLVGRLTRDPESRTFPSGGMVAALGLAVNNRRKTKDGSWQDEPVFLDLEAFGKTAEIMAERLRKGAQILVEGHLKLDTWTDKQTNEKRSKLKIVVDQFQFLDRLQDGRPSQAREATTYDAAPVGGDVDGQEIPF